jgi:hypothetical protein
MPNNEYTITLYELDDDYVISAQLIEFRNFIKNTKYNTLINIFSKLYPDIKFRRNENLLTFESEEEALMFKLRWDYKELERIRNNKPVELIP